VTYSYLHLQNWGVDFQLSNKQSADVLAYAAMLDGKFLPGFVSNNCCDYDLNELIILFIPVWFRKVLVKCIHILHKTMKTIINMFRTGVYFVGYIVIEKCSSQ